MFEKYNVPALYLAKNATLTVFTNGRATCLVVDSGATDTSAVPVHDGFVLTQAVFKSPAGGEFLSTQCRNYLAEKGIKVIPPCMVSSKEITESEEAQNFERRIFPSQAHQSLALLLDQIKTHISFTFCSMQFCNH